MIPRSSRNTIQFFNIMERHARSPPRRITRSSLARFAYTDAPDRAGAVLSQGDHRSETDIEDAIPDIASSSMLRRKRKRTTTVSVPQTRPPLATRKTKKALDDGIDNNNNNTKFKTEEGTGDVVSITSTTMTTTTTTTTTSAAPTESKKRQRKPARKTTDPSTGESTISPPTDWEEMYAIVQSMRSEGGAASNAPVDTMGCERLALTTVSPRDQRFQTLVALMLSSQTKDTVNAVAMHRLQTELLPHAPGAPPGLNLENIIAVAPARLNELIYAVGFHNNKTKYLQQAAAICRDTHGGDIPDTIEGLVSLPGVGPKMAHLCLSAAWGRTEGIGVDVHVHRITNLWGWNGKSGSKNPEDTRAKLESWLPKDKWREINTLLVGLGQTVCLPVGRRCGDCELGLRGLCRAAERKKVLEGRRLRDNVVVHTKGETTVKVEEELVTNKIKDEDGMDDKSLLAEGVGSI
ncbi:DNA glycosylase [Nemania sp. FL0031]|nr:DNA glycosylase [Nemania sp. FL0031]